MSVNKQILIIFDFIEIEITLQFHYYPLIYLSYKQSLKR